MTDSAAINEIMLALKKWTDEKVHSPSLLVSTDNGSFHVAYYAGMGSYDSVPIENYSPLYKSKIEQLFKNGELSVRMLNDSVFLIYFYGSVNIIPRNTTFMFIR